MTPIARRLLLAMAVATGLAGCTTLKTRVAVNSPCQNSTATLYFESGSEALTDAGNQIIALTAKRLKGCNVRELRLLGLADPTGSAQVNLTLSQHRADNVLAAFVREGLPVPKYTLVAAGQKGAVAPNGAIEPVRRQVDVTLVVDR